MKPIHNKQIHKSTVNGFYYIKRHAIPTLILVCSASFASGQKMQHYLSYNFPYTSFFNHTKRNLPLLNAVGNPSLSYKIQKGNYGLELSGTIGAIDFDLWDKNEYSDENLNNRINTPQDLTYLLSSLTFHYLILNKKWIKVSPNAGIAFGWYNADEIVGWNKNYSVDLDWWWPELMTMPEVETKWGAVIGVNATLPVYKSLYVNSDVKFFTFPFSKYSKQNLLFQIGIGYVFNRNKK